MAAERTQSPGRVHRNDDAPDTDAAFRRIAALPDGPERSALRQEVACAWMPMAVRLARRFRHRGETFEDLKQVAQLGLVKAVSRFDPSLGTAFPSFAIPTIRLGQSGVCGDLVDGGYRSAQQSAQLMVGGADLTTQLLYAPRHVHDPEFVTEVTLHLAEAVPGGSADSYPLADTLAGMEPGFDRVVNRETLRPLLRALPERERQILYMRFFCEMTQARTGLQLGVSQMYVSRLITRTCARLHDQVMADPRVPTRTG
ncbi:sigma factor-like helix-turn-helix DNA-binding protein [Streptomyces sp. 4N124]|uniref:sigma factor-like helix-turn-helix DNA-binding protein n=1 Tax=Streptomyces sp. 4N124 TaxID=3457420 RepID=UPI003FD0CC51